MNDLKLWNNIKEGDRDSFEQLFNTHYRDLYRFGMKLSKNHGLIDDSIQDLFFDLWVNQEKLPDVQTIKGYLIRGLKYKILRSKQNELVHDSEQDIPEHGDPSIENQLINEETLEQQHKLLGHFIPQLTKRQQQAIQLRFFHQLSYDEISDIMGISSQASVNLIYKSIKYLREQIGTSGLVVIVLLLSKG